MSAKTLWLASKETFKKFLSDEPFQKAAAVSYFALLSIAPLLLIAISIAGFLYGREAAEGQLVDDLIELMDEQTARTIQEIILHGNTPGKGIFSFISGIMMLLLGAGSVFRQLRIAFNQIWQVKADTSVRKLQRILGEHLLMIAMVLGVGFLLLASLTLSAVLPVMGAYFDYLIPGSIHVWEAVNMLLSLAFMSFSLAMLYKFLSSATHSWRSVWFGAVLTALLFTIGNVLIGLYLGKAGIASTFGAAGSVVMMMVWIYYNALIIFFGAEVIQVFGRYRE